MWEDISDKIGELFIGFFYWIPDLIGAIIIFIIGWIVAVILESITYKALRGMGLNRRLDESSADNVVRRITTDPSRTIGRLIYWLILIITITIVIEALNIPVLTELVMRIYNYIPNFLAAIIIFLVALTFSISLSGLIIRWMGDTPTGKVISTVVPIVVMSIAGFAILEQLKIAPIIITTTFIALIGSVALGFALALGLGGQDIAARLLDQAYDRSRRSLDQARRDIERGRSRAEEDIDRAKRNIK